MARRERVTSGLPPPTLSACSPHALPTLCRLSQGDRKATFAGNVNLVDIFSRSSRRRAAPFFPSERKAETAGFPATRLTVNERQ
jgi:hypothetical protein